MLLSFYSIFTLFNQKILKFPVSGNGFFIFSTFYLVSSFVGSLTQQNPHSIVYVLYKFKIYILQCIHRICKDQLATPIPIEKLKHNSRRLGNTDRVRTRTATTRVYHFHPSCVLLVYIYVGRIFFDVSRSQKNILYDLCIKIYILSVTEAVFPAEKRDESNYFRPDGAYRNRSYRIRQFGITLLCEYLVMFRC